MKRIKLNLAMIAMVAATAFVFAFKPAPKQFDDSLWAYQSGTVTDGSSYAPLDGESCEGEDNICAVMAPEDPSNPGHPFLDSDLQTRITNKDTRDDDVFLKPQP